MVTELWKVSAEIIGSANDIAINVAQNVIAVSAYQKVLPSPDLAVASLPSLVIICMIR
jgi:hypothetical protein